MINHEPFLNPVSSGVDWQTFSDEEFEKVEGAVGVGFKLTTEHRHLVEHIIWTARTTDQRISDAISIPAMKKHLQSIQQSAAKFEKALAPICINNDVNSPEFRTRLYLEDVLRGPKLVELRLAVSSIATCNMNLSGKGGRHRSYVLIDTLIFGLADVYNLANGVSKDERPGISISSSLGGTPGKATGPFVRFVEAVCDLMSCDWKANPDAWASRIRRALDARDETYGRNHQTK